MLENFPTYFKATGTRVAATKETLERYKDKVPDTLLQLWKSDGFGKYNEGLIELVNPGDFESVLRTWLGKEKPNYVPFAISGFGELFYYRKLTETDEDVCIIDIQYRNIETLVCSLDDFFEDFLIDESEREEYLKEPLFQEAIAAKGPLAIHEIFTITPVLALGGAAELQHLEKGNAQVYQDIVFQMTM